MTSEKICCKSETLRIILYKKSHRADKGWSPSLGTDRRSEQPRTLNSRIAYVTKFYTGPRTLDDFLLRIGPGEDANQYSGSKKGEFLDYSSCHKIASSKAMEGLQPPYRTALSQQYSVVSCSTLRVPSCLYSPGRRSSCCNIVRFCFCRKQENLFSI
jgi:hypothetical protein